MTFKQQAIQLFLEKLNEKIDSFQFTLDELSISVMNETKSTAGDKHETALAMLQAEQSRMAEHLYEAIDNKTVFMQLPFDEHFETVTVGSLVQTQRGLFLLSVALSLINIDNKKVIGISPKSPLGEQLIGKQKGDTIEVNGMQHQIVDIK